MASLITRLTGLITAIKSDFDSVDARVTALESGGGGGDPWNYVFLEANAVSIITASVDTALQFPLEPSSQYEIEARLYLQAAATTTGVRFGIKWPSVGVLQNAARAESPSSATAATLRFWGNTASAVVAATGVAVANEGIFGKLEALMVTGPVVTGAFIVTLATEIAASETRIMANSFIRYRKIR